MDTQHIISPPFLTPILSHCNSPPFQSTYSNTTSTTHSIHTTHSHTPTTTPSLSPTFSQSNISSLESLEHHLTSVLYNHYDPQRLSKAKCILQRYNGTDWIKHSSLPAMDGFQMVGYSRTSVKACTDLFEILILTWSPRSKSPIHNHPCERCFLMPLQGILNEERYEVVEGGVIRGGDVVGNGCEYKLVAKGIIPIGRAAWIDDTIGWHAIENTETGVSITLHCYIPGYRRCKIIDKPTSSILIANCLPHLHPQPQLYESIMSQTTSYINQVESNDPSSIPVTLARGSRHMEEMFEKKSTSISFKHNAEPLDDETILKSISFTCDFSVHSGHLFFLNQLMSRADPLALAAEALISSINVNMYSYEMAPVIMLMETHLLQHLASFLGWFTYTNTFPNQSTTFISPPPCPPISFDGIILPGASLCNLTAMHAARSHKYPQTILEGNHSLSLVVFTSEHSHPSILKSCMMMGLGRNACVYVKCSFDGVMDSDALRQAILLEKCKGRVPFMIIGTCGSNITGCFDNCDLLADIADENNCWFHIDGAVGASFILPSDPPFISLTKGMSRASSISWNLHKLLGLPLQCSVLLTRYPNILSTSYQDTIDFLPLDNITNNPSTYQLNSTQPSQKSIMSSRRADAFKAWILWKKLGDVGMANKIRLIYSHTIQFGMMVTDYPNKQKSCHVIKFDNNITHTDINYKPFHLAFQPISTTVCFYFIPLGLSEIFNTLFSENKLDEIESELTLVATMMKKAFISEGSLMLSFNSLPHRPAFWRLHNINPSISEEQMFTILRIMDRIGNEIFPLSYDWSCINQNIKHRNDLTFSSYHISRSLSAWAPPPELLNNDYVEGLTNICTAGEKLLVGDGRCIQ